MKKLRLNFLESDNVEVLTKSQLRKVFGGNAISVTGKSCDSESCSGPCVISSGACKGSNGTCSTTKAGVCVCSAGC